MEPTFDAFLSHAHADAEWVETIAARLEDECQLQIWLDRWVLVPGEPWQQAMARGLDEAKTCCVIVGGATPSGWFVEEVHRALNRQAHDAGFRVIPVICPNGSPDNLPPFVELRTWADFRDDTDDFAFHVVVQGIRGLPIGRRTDLRPKAATLDARRAAVRQRLSDITAVADLLERDVLVELQLRTMNDFLGRE